MQHAGYIDPGSRALAGVRSRNTPKFHRVFELVSQAFYLNALWLACCLVVVTGPAATTALFVSVHLWRTTGEAPSARRFMQTVRGCWRISTLTSLLALGVFAVALTDLKVIFAMGGLQHWVMLAAWIVACEAAALCVVFVFTVLGRGTGGSVWRIVAESARIAVRRPMSALLAVAITAFAGLIVWTVPIALVALGVLTAAGIDCLAGAESSETKPVGM